MISLTFDAVPVLIVPMQQALTGILLKGFSLASIRKPFFLPRLRSSIPSPSFFHPDSTRSSTVAPPSAFGILHEVSSLRLS